MWGVFINEIKDLIFCLLVFLPYIQDLCHPVFGFRPLNTAYFPGNCFKFILGQGKSVLFHKGFTNLEMCLPGQLIREFFVAMYKPCCINGISKFVQQVVAAHLAYPCLRNIALYFSNIFQHQEIFKGDRIILIVEIDP